MRNNKCEDNPFVIARKNAGLKQYQTAEALGVDRSAVAAWEVGRSRPRYDRLKALAELYGCTTDALMGAGGKAV